VDKSTQCNLTKQSRSKGVDLEDADCWELNPEGVCVSVAKRTQLPELDKFHGLRGLVPMMEFSPDPACAQADYTMIYVPETPAFWLAGTTATTGTG